MSRIGKAQQAAQVDIACELRKQMRVIPWNRGDRVLLMMILIVAAANLVLNFIVLKG